MRIATYNVEWFNALFDRRDRPLADGEWSKRYNVTRDQQLTAVAKVLTAMDADAVMVIEAPDHSDRRSTVAALEHFAAAFDLRTRAAMIGFSNDTQQEIALLYDPDALTPRHDPVGAIYEPHAPRFDGVFRMDLDVDTDAEEVTFSKPPLELSIETQSGTRLRMIGVHAKSKAPHGARTPEEVMRISIDNRRKQLAQCIWLRRRIVGHLDAGESVIVLGDFNDGPGLDEYEKLFGHSGVEIVLGLPEMDQSAMLYDPNARQALQTPLSATISTARFYNVETRSYLSALLDYIMVSPDLAARGGQWRVWHPFDDPEIYAVPELRQALLDASDHFPVTLDIAI